MRTEILEVKISVNENYKAMIKYRMDDLESFISQMEIARALVQLKHQRCNSA